MRQFYLTFPKSHALSDQLSWTHYRLLMRVENENARNFYNYILKCFVLIDLKIGDLTHQDLGQIQMYVHYFEARKGVRRYEIGFHFVVKAYFMSIS